MRYHISLEVLISTFYFLVRSNLNFGLTNGVIPINTPTYKTSYNKSISIFISNIHVIIPLDAII